MKQTENRFVVANKGWAESIPEWIKDEIRAERMINGMCNVVGSKKSNFNDVGDAELVAYLFTASFVAPLCSEDQKIYLYLTGKLMIKCKGLTKETLPDFMQGIELCEYEQKCLDDLRYKIFKARGEVSHPIFDILKKLKGGKN